MLSITNVEVFKAGEVTDGLGYTNKYTIDDLNEIADTYNISLHEAPVVIAHDNDRNWGRLLTSKTQLANGWVTKLYVNDSSLYANIKVDEYTYNCIKDESLKKRSIGLYPKQAKNNPVAGKYYLRHLALLGAEPPAVKGLADITIYSESNMNEETKNILNDKAAEWLAYALIDDGNGFSGEIAEITPEPSEDNNWLYDSDTESYSGSFYDNLDQLFNFTLTKKDGNWVSSITMDKSTIEDEQPAEFNEQVSIEQPEQVLVQIMEQPGEVEATIAESTAAEQPAADELTTLQNQLLAMEARLKAYEEAEATRVEEQAMEFCDELYQNGYLTESQIQKEALYQIITALEKLSSTLTYSDGNQQVPVVKSIKQLLKSFPRQLTYSDATIARQLITPVNQYGTDKSNKEYALIKQFMEQNKITNFAEGRRLYNKTKKY